MLSSSAQEAGFRLEHYGLIGSTNDLGMTRARALESSRLWVVADAQEGGKGRLGRVWTSPQGNLYASVVLVGEAELKVSPQLGFVAGVALIEALRELAPHAALTLKWPNDVLAGDAKLAGILLEGTTLADGRFGCVIGFGVNCASAPTGLPYPAICLKDLGADVSPAQIMHQLSHSFAFMLGLWSRGDHFSIIRERWLSHAGLPGRPLGVQRGNERLLGRFRTIDHSGRLILDTDQGEALIEAGDVFLPSILNDNA